MYLFVYIKTANRQCFPQYRTPPPRPNSPQYLPTKAQRIITTNINVESSPNTSQIRYQSPQRMIDKIGYASFQQQSPPRVAGQILRGNRSAFDLQRIESTRHLDHLDNLDISQDRTREHDIKPENHIPYSQNNTPRNNQKNANTQIVIPTLNQPSMYFFSPIDAKINKSVIMTNPSDVQEESQAKERSSLQSEALKQDISQIQEESPIQQINQIKQDNIQNKEIENQRKSNQKNEEKDYKKGELLNLDDKELDTNAIEQLALHNPFDNTKKQPIKLVTLPTTGNDILQKNINIDFKSTMVEPKIPQNPEIKPRLSMILQKNPIINEKQDIALELTENSKNQDTWSVGCCSKEDCFSCAFCGCCDEERNYYPCYCLRLFYRCRLNCTLCMSGESESMLEDICCCCCLCCFPAKNEKELFETMREIHIKEHTISSCRDCLHAMCNTNEVPPKPRMSILNEKKRIEDELQKYQQRRNEDKQKVKKKESERQEKFRESIRISYKNRNTPIIKTNEQLKNYILEEFLNVVKRLYDFIKDFKMSHNKYNKDALDMTIITDRLFQELEAISKFNEFHNTTKEIIYKLIEQFVRNFCIPEDLIYRLGVMIYNCSNMKESDPGYIDHIPFKYLYIAKEPPKNSDYYDLYHQNKLIPIINKLNIEELNLPFKIQKYLQYVADDSEKFLFRTKHLCRKFPKNVQKIQEYMRNHMQEFCIKERLRQIKKIDIEQLKKKPEVIEVLNEVNWNNAADILKEMN
jgi:hypothetical protein